MAFCLSSATLEDFPRIFTSYLTLSFLYWTQCCLILSFFAVITFVFLLLWRFWAFTVVPLLYPNRPNEVPYWIPFLGHTYAFLEDADGLLTYGRKHFNNSDEPYALNVAGEKLYVVTSPEGMRTVRENASRLSRYELTHDFVIALGLKPAVGKRIDRRPTQVDNLNLLLRPGAMQSPFAQVVENFSSEKQNGTVEQFRTNLHDFFRHIENSMRWNCFSAKYTKFTSREEKEVSLLGWCGEVMVGAATKCYFDEALLQIEPNLSQIVFDFDKEMCSSISKHPHTLGTLSSVAKEKGIRAFTAYLKLPKMQRAGDAHFIRDLEEEYRMLGLDEGNLASLMMIVYWVINANTYKLTFWLLSHLVANPALFTSVRTEISGAVPAASSLDIKHLQNCPMLIASLNETLRLTAASCTLHRVLAPTTIGTKTLPCSGSKILTPYRQLHFREEIFGPDVHAFRPSRFRKKDLARSDSFGGARSMVVAEGAVLAFVALAIGRFGLEIALSSGESPVRPQMMAMGEVEKAMDLELGCKPEEPMQRFPRLDEKNGGLGIMGPVAGDDLILKVTRNGTGQ